MRKAWTSVILMRRLVRITEEADDFYYVRIRLAKSGPPEWAMQDSNLRHLPCKGSALTN